MFQCHELGYCSVVPLILRTKDLVISQPFRGQNKISTLS